MGWNTFNPSGPPEPPLEPPLERAPPLPGRGTWTTAGRGLSLGEGGSQALGALGPGGPRLTMSDFLLDSFAEYDDSWRRRRR